MLCHLEHVHSTTFVNLFEYPLLSPRTESSKQLGSQNCCLYRFADVPWDSMWIRGGEWEPHFAHTMGGVGPTCASLNFGIGASRAWGRRCTPTGALRKRWVRCKALHTQGARRCTSMSNPRLMVLQVLRLPRQCPWQSTRTYSPDMCKAGRFSAANAAVSAANDFHHTSLLHMRLGTTNLLQGSIMHPAPGILRRRSHSSGDKDCQATSLAYRSRSEHTLGSKTFLRKGA